MKKILVVGSANVDCVIGVRQAPELGETILSAPSERPAAGRGPTRRMPADAWAGTPRSSMRWEMTPWAVSW